MIDWDEFNVNTQRLFQRAACGDVEARDELWDVVRPSLLHHFGQYLRRVGIFEGDPLGFCYLAFHDAVRLYDPSRGTPFLSYCIRVLKYRLATFVMEQRELGYRECRFSDLLDYGESDYDPVHEEEEVCRMLQAYESFEEDTITMVMVRSLPSPASNVAVMIIEGYTPNQIMSELGMSKSTYYRVKRRIRSLLEECL